MNQFVRSAIFALSAFVLFIYSASSVSAEQINRFDTAITVNADGSIQVVEKINYFFDVARHGIFREIPSTKTNEDGKKFKLDFDVVSVTDPSEQMYRYTTTTENDYLKIKIGDPNKTFSGNHTYIITYTVRGALTYFSDHDELYWNVTGNGWQVPIDMVHAVAMLPTSIPTSDIRVECFVGETGSTLQNCQKTIYAQTAEFALSDELFPFQGMTVVIGFPKGHVAVLEPKAVIPFEQTLLGKLVIAGLIVLAILWYLVYPVWLILKWWLYGRDPDVGKPVSAWYDPPKNREGRKLLPGETGALVDEVVDIPDITATIVDLARRGYFKIVEKKKNDFYLVRAEKDPADDTLNEYEKKLIDGVFTDNEVRVKDLEIVDTVLKVEEMLYKGMVGDGFIEKNPKTTRTYYTVIGSIALFMFNVPLAIVAFLFGRNMPAKTLFGSQQASVARGLRNFLKGQERQLTFQAKNQMFFEKLLPYAVAFGVEKYWAKQFEDITMTQPSWYQGYSHDPFTASYFANSLSSSMSSFARAATPTRSSSGFSSGFSGGSSGGGGGGGGGGSW